MDVFNTYVTPSNITIFLGLLTGLISGLVILWFKIKTLIYDQQQKFLEHMQTRLDTQTQHIENCIHKIPNHPENSDTSGEKIN